MEGNVTKRVNRLQGGAPAEQMHGRGPGVEGGRRVVEGGGPRPQHPYGLSFKRIEIDVVRCMRAEMVR